MDEKRYQKKIIANDKQGLTMISALMNSSKVKVSDIKYLPSNKIFLLSVKRLMIENDKDSTEINSICRVDYVSKVKSKNIDQKNRNLILELLAIDYLKNKKNFEIKFVLPSIIAVLFFIVTLEDQQK